MFVNRAIFSSDGTAGHDGARYTSFSNPSEYTAKKQSYSMTHTILGDVNRILSTSDESNFEQNAQLMAEEGDLTEISLSETPKPQSPEIKDTDAEDISNTDNSKQGWFSKFGAGNFPFFP